MSQAILTVKGLNASKVIYGFFSNTDDSEEFIIRLPEEKTTSTVYLILGNRRNGFYTYQYFFTITTKESEYEDLEGFFAYNFLLNSSIKIDEEDAGSVYINEHYGSFSDISYQSK
ncbi:hypothetical protein [Saccharicrinis sp. GN24d3]|uniref:hypothetical protein n=1 Tax=Saccharicrinis sp. GN24d3 TaxID=3458416 RepID=UPI004035C5A6